MECRQRKDNLHNLYIEIFFSLNLMSNNITRSCLPVSNCIASWKHFSRPLIHFQYSLRSRIVLQSDFGERGKLCLSDKCFKYIIKKYRFLQKVYFIAATLDSPQSSSTMNHSCDQFITMLTTKCYFRSAFSSYCPHQNSHCEFCKFYQWE